MFRRVIWILVTFGVCIVVNILFVVLIQTEIDGNIQLLKQKDEEVKETLSRLENQDQLSIDDAVVTTAPLYRQ